LRVFLFGTIIDTSTGENEMQDYIESDVTEEILAIAEELEYNRMCAEWNLFNNQECEFDV
jgi:hypothetical protein